MWYKKFKKKKLQCFLIGLLIFISALIFSSGASIISSINNYVQKYYSNNKFYNMVIYSANESSKEDILNWCRNNSKITDIITMPSYESGNNIYHNKEKLKISDYDILPIENYKNVPYGINKIKSLDSGSCPKEGEVWITQLFADTYKISLGDSLKIDVNGKMVSLKVTSLINDSLQPSNLISVVYLYVNKNNIQDFEAFTKKETILTNTKKDTDALKVEKNLVTDTKPGGYAGTKDLLIQNSTMLSSMMGGAAAFSSVVIFIVSIFLIRFLVWNNILKEYKSIGMYKALGFTKRQILKLYILGYSITAIVSSMLGALCSIPVLNYISARVLKYIGDFSGINIDFKAICVTIILFSVIVILNLYLVIKRTNKISPVNALRTGVTSSRKKLTRSFIKNNSSPIVLAVNDIFKYKKVTFCIILSLTLSLILIMLTGNLNYATSKMKDNANVWFGIPKSNVTICSSAQTSSKEINYTLDKIKNDKRVQNYVYGSIFTNKVQIDAKKYKLKSNSCGIQSYSSFDKVFGFSIIDGHNPEKRNEVSVSLNVLRDSGLSVGDYIELTNSGSKDSYLISGSFSALMSDGYVVRMLKDTKIEQGQYNEIFVNVKDSYDKNAFEKDFNKNASTMSAVDIIPEMKYAIDSIPGLIIPITSLFMVSFAVFSIIIIFNIVIMNIRDNKRNFGIMKALGFKSSEIRNRYLYRILILTGISSILSAAFNLVFSRNIIKAMMSGQDVLIIWKAIIGISIAAMLILIVLTVMLCTRLIKNTKPTELIEE